jgi:L-threonylcarbamoyladenylate synthase
MVFNLVNYTGNTLFIKNNFSPCLKLKKHIIILTMLKNKQKLVKILKSGGMAVIPTDTIYGLVGSALRPETVERIYKIRRRSPNKPMIILIGKISDLSKFGMKPDQETKNILRRLWPARIATRSVSGGPGEISVILPCRQKKFHYLHRGTNSLAFRLPKKIDLINLLQITGPLVSPSANPEGLEPAKNITEAKKYFGDKVDIYISAGTINKSPSTLIEIKNGKIKILREGRIEVNL